MASNTKLLTGLGKAIKIRRKKLGMSQADLSAVSGLTQNYISKIENGDKNISLLTALSISESLKLSLCDFFKLELSEMKADRDAVRIESMLKKHTKKDRKLILDIMKNISKNLAKR